MRKGPTNTNTGVRYSLHTREGAITYILDAFEVLLFWFSLDFGDSSKLLSASCPAESNKEAAILV